MKLFNHDTENSNIDNAWIDVIPVMATIIVRISVDNNNNHYLEVGLLPPGSLETSEPTKELISWEHIMGEVNEERELKVDIDGEYCHITVDDYHIQFKNQLSEESIVVDVFNGDEVYKELGYVT